MNTLLWGVVVYVTIMVHGHPNTTRYVTTERYGELSKCGDAAERMAKRLQPKSASTQLIVACGRQPDKGII